MTDQMQIVQLFPEQSIRSTIVTIENLNIMIDCGGIVPYSEDVIKVYAEKLPNISSIIITSSSANYCGALPLLKCLGYRKVVYTAKNIAKNVKLTLEGLRNNYLYDFGIFKPIERQIDEIISSKNESELSSGCLTSEVIDECSKAEFLLEQEVNTRLQNLQHLPNVILELINSANESVALVLEHQFYEQKILYGADLALTDNISQNNFGQNFRKSSAGTERMSLWYFHAPQDLQKIVSGPRFAYDRSLGSNVVPFDAKSVSDIFREAGQLNRKIFIFSESEQRFLQHFYLLKQSLASTPYCVHYGKESEQYGRALRELLVRHRAKGAAQLNSATVVFVIGPSLHSGPARDIIHHFNSPNNIILTIYSAYTPKMSPEAIYIKSVLDNRVRGGQKQIYVETTDIKLAPVSKNDQKHKNALEQLADRFRKAQFDLQDCLHSIDFITIQQQLYSYNNELLGTSADHAEKQNVENIEQQISKDVILWILYKLSKYYEQAIQFTSAQLTENDVVSRPDNDWEIQLNKPLPLTSGFGYRIPYQSPNLLPEGFDETTEKILKAMCNVLDRKLSVEYLGSADRQKALDRFRISEKSQQSYESIINKVILEHLGAKSQGDIGINLQNMQTASHQSAEQLGVLQFNSLFRQQSKVQQIVRREILLQKELQDNDEGAERKERPEATIKYVSERLALQYQHIVVIAPQSYMNENDIRREHYIPEDEQFITIEKNKHKGSRSKSSDKNNAQIEQQMQDTDDNVLNVPENKMAFISAPFKCQIQIQLKKRNQDLILDLNGQPFSTKLFGSIEDVLKDPYFLAADRRFLKHKQEEQFRDFTEDTVDSFFKVQKHFNQTNKRYIKGDIEVTYIGDKNELVIAGKVSQDLPTLINELRTDQYV